MSQGRNGTKKPPEQGWFLSCSRKRGFKIELSLAVAAKMFLLATKVAGFQDRVFICVNSFFDHAAGLIQKVHLCGRIVCLQRMSANEINRVFQIRVRFSSQRCCISLSAFESAICGHTSLLSNAYSQATPREKARNKERICSCPPFESPCSHRGRGRVWRWQDR